MRRMSWAGLMFGLVLVVLTSSLLAVHDESLFELGDSLGLPGSADIAGDSGQAGCDWTDLFDADPTPAEIEAAVDACGGVAAAFAADDLAAGSAKDETSFASGKNNDPISAWSWKTGNSPGKDDLSNVYAYATLDAEELIVYAGIERLSPGGDSHIDLEFNQAPVTLDKAPPCGNDRSDGSEDRSPCEFVGQKTVGDFLVVMDFVNGGALGSLEVRRWDGGTYVLVDSVGGEGCNVDDTVCAFNNSVPIAGGAWVSYDGGGDPVQQLEPHAFTEAGINVTQLFGQTPCVVSITAKSRTSASINSALKDFAQTSFEICSVEIDKQASGPSGDPLSKLGDPITFEYTISNTGGGDLLLDTVDDSREGDLTVEAQSAGCSPLLAGASCSFMVQSVIDEDDDDPFVSSVLASFSGPLGPTVGSVADADDVEVNLFQPSVDVVNSGDGLSTPGNVVHYTITITNTGSSDSPELANGTVLDSLLGDLLDPANPYVTSSNCSTTLPVGGTCVVEAARTVLAGDPGPLSNTVDVMYNPAGGFPNEIADSDGHLVDLVYPGMLLSVTVTPSMPLPGDTVTYTFTLQNTGDIALDQISVIDSVLGDVSSYFPNTLQPGETVVVQIQRVIQPDDPNPLVSDATSVFQLQGLPNQLTNMAGFSLDLGVPCALSPGFWKGGEGQPKWDDLDTDSVAQAAGFENATHFPWADSSLGNLTYLGVLNLSAAGDVTRQLGFKYVAARLNEATFGVPGSTETLLGDIDAYFADNPVGSDPRGQRKNQGQALLGTLNGYFSAVGEANCPSPSEF